MILGCKKGKTSLKKSGFGSVLGLENNLLSVGGGGWGQTESFCNCLCCLLEKLDFLLDFLRV